VHIFLKLLRGVDSLYEPFPFLLDFVSLLVPLQQRHHECFGLLNIQDEGDGDLLDSSDRTIQHLVDFLEVSIQGKLAEDLFLFGRDLELG